MPRLVSVSIVCGLFLLGACSSGPAKPPSGVRNAKCPMSDDILDGKGPTIFYNQATIGFCCEKCVANFAKLDGPTKQAKIDAAK